MSGTQYSQTQIPALISLISSAAQSIEKLYGELAPEKPNVPTLDHIEPHPLDKRITHPDLRNALQVLEGACAQLVSSVARPQHTLINKLMLTFESSALHVVTRSKITDVLEEGGKSGMHISELAKRSGLDQGKLGRVMRLLVSKHVYREVEEDIFANNRLNMLLHSKNPMSCAALHILEESRDGTRHLADVLAEPVWGPSLVPNHSLISRSLGVDVGLYDWYESHGGAMQGARFGVAMIAWGESIEAGAVIDDFPWGDLPQGTSVCDVGGSIGAITMQLAKRYPDLLLKLQDTPKRIEQAKEEVWPKLCPEAMQTEGQIVFKSMDFLVEPPIPNCDIYFLKNIILNWQDEECITILKNVKVAMKPSSRVLIHEYVLAPAVASSSTGTSSLSLAPEPLLPNYGVGAIRQYNLDMSVMTLFNARQRRLEEFIELGEKAGLRFVKLWRVGDGFGGIGYQLRSLVVTEQVLGLGFGWE